MLTKEELKRYSRHILLSEVGIEGQEKLKSASVLVVGLGGLGSPLAMYLAASGIGTLGLVDFDVVDHSNLQRQIIHRTSDKGQLKIESAKQTLNAINPEVNVVLHNERLTSDNALDILKHYDLVADGTDNFQTRYLVNDACVLLGIPNVYASVYKFEGQASVFATKEGPCYRCIFPSPPEPGTVPSCAEAGILGVLPGIMGTIQATEVVKLILNKGNALIGRLLLYNALDMAFSEIKLTKDPNCALCGDHPTIKELIDYDVFCGVNNKKSEITDTTNPIKQNSWKIEPNELSKILNDKDLFLLDVREPYEYEIASIKGSILIPSEQISNHLDRLPKNKTIVVLCHHSGRSKKVVNYLIGKGFNEVRFLLGGIDRYALEIDHTLERY
ncbi:molybdopterin-synthase adenylyltransferase MoeB [Aestuariivivens sediminicola]|uniref:molybdopterin-synthase adenylyltransferase MoeB n=1 Tax=Aestuariivivens sediminicola TaxID=2913560 RepID=UPI001F56A159|nr:molybdopterin-synthase adenylyltransferase MoeB [Aestuariivivens sediminicola]